MPKGEAYGRKKLSDRDADALAKAAKTFARLYNKANDPQWFDQYWSGLVEDAGISD